MSNIPATTNSHSVCVICEGFEEQIYFERLLQLGLWNRIYSFKVVNAKSADHIPAVFQDKYQNNRYEAILIFCDTDNPPFSKYSMIKDKINRFLGKRSAAEKVVIFANPCTMQIVLSHFGDVSLSSPSKRANAEIIEQLTGIANYDAHNEQIREMCSKIKRDNYTEMYNRIKLINHSYDVNPSTNFSSFIERFESDDPKWIKEIQNALE